ncbi:MAG: mechanosensitive ion channel [Hellea sp.]|nr:mechanosensitive ion channel [Hellea sp.]
MEFLQQLLPGLDQTKLTIHLIIFVGNIALFLLARPILKFIDPSAVTNSKVRLFRSINVLVFLLHLFGMVLIRQGIEFQSYFINIGYSIMAVYGAMLFYNFLCAQSRKRFGKQRTVDEKSLFFETYSSRMVNLVVLIILILTTIYILILVWNAEEMFTGIYGILAAFLAFTSGIWAPDIISGLIILNTEILEDGDVVVIDGHPNEYVIARVTLIYLVLYDIRNNHRTLMRNSQFTESRVDNLSRVTSSSGLRRAMVYKIGYPAFSGNRDTRLAQLADFKSRIEDMFKIANQTCAENENIKINTSKPFTWAMTSAGDFALEYTLWVYLERIPNTKITSTIRRHLMGTIYGVNEAVYDASIAENIDLSTPNVHQVVAVDPNVIPPKTANIITES